MSSLRSLTPPSSSDDTDHDHEHPHLNTDQSSWKAKYAALRDEYTATRALLDETRADLDEFTKTSQELEAEMEKELEQTERTRAALEERVMKVEDDRDNWKRKYVALNASHNSLQSEITALRALLAKHKSTIVELELGNDDLERNERVANESFRDMENKYSRVLEEKLLMEGEVMERSRTLAEENQRLKDQVLDLQAEVAAMQRRQSRLISPTTPSAPPVPPIPQPSQSRPTGLSSSTTTTARTPPAVSRIPSKGTATTAKSKPLTMVGEMVNRTRALQARIGKRHFLPRAGAKENQTHGAPVQQQPGNRPRKSSISMNISRPIALPKSSGSSPPTTPMAVNGKSASGKAGWVVVTEEDSKATIKGHSSKILSKAHPPLPADPFVFPAPALSSSRRSSMSSGHAPSSYKGLRYDDDDDDGVSSALDKTPRARTKVNPKRRTMAGAELEKELERARPLDLTTGDLVTRVVLEYVGVEERRRAGHAAGARTPTRDKTPSTAMPPPLPGHKRATSTVTTSFPVSTLMRSSTTTSKPTTPLSTHRPSAAAGLPPTPPPKDDKEKRRQSFGWNGGSSVLISSTNSTRREKEAEAYRRANRI